MKLVSDYSVDLIHYEEVSFHPIIQYMLIGVLVLMAYLRTEVPPGIPSNILALVTVMLVIVYTTFRKLRITVSDTHLTVGFGYIRHTVRIDNIDTIEATHAPWYRYGGFGIRMGWDWSVAYIQNWRPGVRVVPKKGRVLYFSSNQPDIIAQKIKVKLAH